MKHQKKLTLTMALLLSAGLLTSCGQSTSPTSSSQGDQYRIYQLAVDAGFEGTYEEWLETIRGADGKDGVTPHIGENGNWWIGTTDTGIKATGKDGDKGDTGSKGETGDKGDKGETGEKGDTGDKGDKGDAGVTPHIGENGNWWIGTTDTGIKATGKDGDKGDKGDTGSTGDKGETGSKGDTGDKGADGLTPYIGENGNWWIGTTDTGVVATGKDGDKGDKGDTGSTGDKGETGSKGDTGDKGADGVTPHIGENGNWWIGTTDTGVKAEAPSKEVYTITLDLRGGEFLHNESTYYANILEGSMMDFGIPFRMGFIFKGWVTGFEVTSGYVTTTTPILQSMTLYAKWENPLIQNLIQGTLQNMGNDLQNRVMNAGKTLTNQQWSTYLEFVSAIEKAETEQEIWDIQSNFQNWLQQEFSGEEIDLGKYKEEKKNWMDGQFKWLSTNYTLTAEDENVFSQLLKQLNEAQSKEQVDVTLQQYQDFEKNVMDRLPQDDLKEYIQKTTEEMNANWDSLINQGYVVKDYQNEYDLYLQQLALASTKEEIEQIATNARNLFDQIRNNAPVDIESLKQQTLEQITEMMRQVEQDFGIDIKAYEADFQKIKDQVLTIQSKEELDGIFEELNNLGMKIMNDNPKSFAVIEIQNTWNSLQQNGLIPTTEQQNFYEDILNRLNALTNQDGAKIQEITKEFQDFALAIYLKEEVEKRKNQMIEQWSQLQSMGDVSLYQPQYDEFVKSLETIQNEAELNDLHNRFEMFYREVYESLNGKESALEQQRTDALTRFYDDWNAYLTYGEITPDFENASISTIDIIKKATTEEELNQAIQMANDLLNEVENYKTNFKCLALRDMDAYWSEAISKQKPTIEQQGQYEQLRNDILALTQKDEKEMNRISDAFLALYNELMKM